MRSKQKIINNLSTIWNSSNGDRWHYYFSLTMVSVSPLTEICLVKHPTYSEFNSLDNFIDTNNISKQQFRGSITLLLVWLGTGTRSSSGNLLRFIPSLKALVQTNCCCCFSWSTDSVYGKVIVDYFLLEMNRSCQWMGNIGERAKHA